MTRVTFFLDSAGRVTQSTAGHEWLTVVGLAIHTSDVEAVCRTLPTGTRKWSESSLSETWNTVNFALDQAVAVIVLQLHKKQPMWREFWRDGANYHHRMSSKERSRVGFVKPSTVIRYATFGDCSGPLLAECLKREGPAILDSQGRNIIELAVVLDSDIQGDENQDTFKFLWETYAAKSDLLRNLNVGLVLDKVEFRTEQQDPVLLLPDHIAGCMQCEVGVPDSDLPAALDRDTVTTLAKRLRFV
jgi:hypothetical protein